MHGWFRGQKNEQQNNVPALKLIMRLQVHGLFRSRGLGSSRNAAAKETIGYKNTVKIDLLKGRVLRLNFKYVDELLSFHAYKDLKILSSTLLLYAVKGGTGRNPEV